MKRKVRMIAILATILILAGCSRQNDSTNHSEWSHTYEGYPVVYITPDISAEGLCTIYEVLEAPHDGKATIKLSDTETDEGFGWSDLIEDLSLILDDPTIIEDHQGEDFSEFDYTILLSHFRSHDTVGFDGAVNQTASLTASSENASAPADGQYELEKLAENGKLTVENLDGHILYINVMDRLSIESAGIKLPDTNSYSIGILASYDPVALDQACIDYLYMVQEGFPFAAHIESLNGIHTLIYAEQIGLGSRTYALHIVDD